MENTGEHDLNIEDVVMTLNSLIGIMSYLYAYTFLNVCQINDFKNEKIKEKS